MSYSFNHLPTAARRCTLAKWHGCANGRTVTSLHHRRLAGESTCRVVQVQQGARSAHGAPFWQSSIGAEARKYALEHVMNKNSVKIFYFYNCISGIVG